MVIQGVEANTEWSRRIALPLAITVHILLFMLLSRSGHLRPTQTDARAIVVQLIPFLQPKAPPVPAPTLPPPMVHQQAASPGGQKNRSSPRESASTAPVVNAANSANPAPITEAPKESAEEGKPVFNDPSALVKSYSYENSKSDLQKAIESHGGTVALTKGKYDDFHEQMDFAVIPDCTRPDALKHDPPKIGPVTIGGQLALLFWAHAAITGKCKMP